MVLDTILLDVLRASHLTLFAAGMGTSLFHEYLTFRSMADPITKSEIASIEKLHNWIRFAFVGLWVTGLILVYVRTSFDLANFSPKLWTKLGLMGLMSLNAVLIGVYVLPMLRKNLGRSMLNITPRDLRTATGIATVSMFAWSSGMILGSSIYLKTAPWDVLLTAAAVWFTLCAIGGQISITMLRVRIQADDEGEDQTTSYLG